MNGYEVNILLETEGDARAVITKYESKKSAHGDYLEEIIPKLFDTSFSSDTKFFCLSSISRNINEIILSCYGSKYPEFKIDKIFYSLKISGPHAIKVKKIYDGDGPDENYCIVNSEKCSLQKYLAFYRKKKIGYVSKGSKKKSSATKLKSTRSEDTKAKEVIFTEQQEAVVRELGNVISENEKALIVRLLIRSKKSRTLVKDIFSPCLGADSDIDFDKFRSRFGSSVSSEEYEISWCYLKSITVKHHTWSQCPENIIKYLRTVFEQGNYIYLGFGLESLGEGGLDPSKYRVDMGVRQMTDLESLAVALSAIEGVSKAFVKYRPTGKLGKEYYAFYPYSGRTPYQALVSISKDYEWPTAW